MDRFPYLLIRRVKGLSAQLCILTVALGCGGEQDVVQEPATPREASADAPKEKAQEDLLSVSDTEFRDAAAQGKEATVRRAIDEGIRVDAVDGQGRTALHLAAFDGRVEVVKLLIENGAAIDHRDEAGRTALIYAATGPNRETVDLLLEAGGAIDVADRVEGFTALMFAAAEGQLEVVQALLKHGADVALRDNDGDSARDFAVQNGHRAISELLSE
ncbi:MAG: ankyrin repeat domain-containing protein [Planctomycetota bacterium]